MHSTPFLSLVAAKAPLSKMRLKPSMFNLYYQPKPALRLRLPQVQFDDIQYLADSDDEDVPLAAIDPDSLLFFVNYLKELGVSPYTVMSDLGLQLPRVFLDDELWVFFDELVLELRKCRYQRLRNPQISSFEHVLRCFKFCKNIIFLVGAGISVASGIPDFRSENGIYANLGKYELRTPTDMFSLDFFKQNKLPFYRFALEIMPYDKYQPTFTHLFIAECHRRGKLLRVYTQNIDCLEQKAGIPQSKMISCHGSFATASCMVCKRKVQYQSICDRMRKKQVPLCQHCSPDRYFIQITPYTVPHDIPECVLKPDIVFFGEKLKDLLGDCIEIDSKTADMLIIVGSSLKVKPIAGLVGAVPREIPQILINRERISGSHEFDVELLGDCEGIFARIVKSLGWYDDMLAARQGHEDMRGYVATIVKSGQSEVVLQKIIGHEQMYKVVYRK